MKKWFTLMEILIVTVIVGMLGVLLMRTYVTMTRIAFRVQQEKQVTEQAVMLTQVVQNLSDSMTIDYAKYNAEFWTSHLTQMSGLVDTLYLTDGTQTVSVWTTGDCQQQVAYMTGNGCAVVLSYTGQNPIVLTQTGRANITPLQFKIIPYAAADDYFADPSLCPVNLGSCLYHPWFWMMTQMHTPYIHDTRESNISIPVQVFFSLPNIWWQ